MNQTPFQSRHGLRVTRGPIPRRSIFPPGSLRGAERPLLMQFPGVQIVSFHFRSIPLAAPSIAVGASAWFGLGSWRFPDDSGQQMALVGYRAELSSTNPTPDTDADYTNVSQLAAWGTSNGTGAAVVVGRDLTWVSRGQWSSGPNNIPYVETNAANSPFGAGVFGERLIWHFAPGKISDNPQPAVYRTGQTTPLAMLLPNGSRLDAALVVRRAQVHGITRSDGIMGRCYVELIFASMFTRGDFVE